MKNFFVLIALLAASVFAAVGDEFVEDRSNATDEFVEMTTESSEVMTDTDIKESVVKTAESDQPMDTIAKNETTTRHRLGTHERLNYTMLPYTGARAWLGNVQRARSPYMPCGAAAWWATTP